MSGLPRENVAILQADASPADPPSFAGLRSYPGTRARRRVFSFCPKGIGSYRDARDARVAELVDAHDSKSCSARSVGSIPSTGTINTKNIAFRRHPRGV